MTNKRKEYLREKKEDKRIKDNFIKLHIDYYNIDCNINYIYQGDLTYLLLVNNKSLGYIYIEDFDYNIDEIKTKKDENNMIYDIVDHLVNDYAPDFMLWDILNYIK